MATTAPQQLALLFDAVLDEAHSDDFVPNYNVAPTTQIWHVIDTALQGASPGASEISATRSLGRAHWGLLPAWSKNRSRAASMINARSETLTMKPSFKPLLKTHRCVVPVDGYYEWRTVGIDPSVKQPKQPYFIRSTDNHPLAIAGLWTTWRDDERGGSIVTSCCLITTEPSRDLATIHDRMPCILYGEEIGDWLSEPEAPLHLLRSAQEGRLTATSVSTAVNNVRNKGAALIEPTVTTLF